MLEEEKGKCKVKPERGLDLRALVEDPDSRPILPQVCHPVREVTPRCHLELRDQVISLGDLMDQHLVVLDRVGVRDFLFPL